MEFFTKAVRRSKMTDEQASKIAELKKQIIASAILREAGRLAGGNTRIHTGALMFAVEDYKKVLAEMEKNGL
jgi:hypothetical protein